MPGTTPQVGDIVQVVQVFTTKDQIAENTMHYIVSGVTAGGAPLSQYASDFSAQWAGVAAALLPIQATYYGCKVRNLVNPATMSARLANPTVGTVAGGMLPKQVAPVLSFFTSLSGSKNRGRIYLPFAPTTFATADGQLTNAARLLYEVRLLSIAPLTITVGIGPGTATLSLVIRHGHGPIPNPVPPGTVTSVATQVVQLKLGTQRKRGDYGRINTPGF